MKHLLWDGAYQLWHVVLPASCSFALPQLPTLTDRSVFPCPPPTHPPRHLSPTLGAQLWFARVLRDGFAAQGAGLFVPFREVGAAHLDTLLAKAGRGGR